MADPGIGLTRARGAAQKVVRRLGFRVAAFLSVALLPVGLIAVMQTQQVGRIAQERSELTLLALTEQAALAERREIQRALGAAEALAALMPTLSADLPACIERFQTLVAGTSTYSYAGYTPASGLMECSSTGRPFDFNGVGDFDDAIADPRVRVAVHQEAPLSGRSVIIASHPVTRDGLFDGYVSISLPHEELDPGPRTGVLHDTLELTTVNARGGILTATDGLDGAGARLPPEPVVQALLSGPADVVPATDGLGRDRVFAAVPIVQDEVFAIGSWSAQSTLARSFGVSMPPWAFPIIMWLVSLLVAYVAVHRLVIRHMLSLQRRMRSFARGRAVDTVPRTGDMPAEIAAMEDDFADMTTTILRDEAEAEARIARQTVLLKEVHHRVKNNLQLISSIINMQLRQLNAPEARDALSRVQDRVLGIAAVHRRLYQSADVVAIDASGVLREIVGQLVSLGEHSAQIELLYDLESLDLYPDQAVPLSLFATEAATNAIRYIGTPAGGTSWIEIALEAPPGAPAVLTVSNSTGTSLDPHPREEGSGLGTQLIRAFAAQIGGTIERREEDGVYAVSLSFEVEDFQDARAVAAE